MSKDWFQKSMDTLSLNGKGERTQQAYTRALRMLVDFYGKRPEEISEAELETYFLRRKNLDHWSANTLRICYCGIRFYFVHVLGRNFGLFNILRAKNEARLPTVLSREEVRSHQRIGYAALFEASAGAIKKLAADPRHLGGDIPGFLVVLHTWGRQLQYHPHIHYLVPGGAISSTDRQWHASSVDFYLPVRALSKIFRAKFRDAMAEHGLLAHIPPEAWNIDWNVNCQPVGDGQATLAYLARYVFKVAISESRIVSSDQEAVTFRYRKVHSNRLRTLRLPIPEFMRRFLQHVLPSGLMKVRYFGFLSPSCAVPLEELKARIAMAHGFAQQLPAIEIEPPAPMRCPHCGGSLRFLRALAPPKLQHSLAIAIHAMSYSGP